MEPAATLNPRPGRAEQDQRERVGTNIYWLRMREGLNQQELADDIGVDRTMISAWERARRLPSPQNLERLAERFGKEPGWFYSDHHFRDD
jgi:transcriptional regulator with XRE-family HTH domain